VGEVVVDAEIDRDAAHPGDAEAGGEREALEPDRREAVQRAHGQGGGDRDRLGGALGQCHGERDDRAGGDDDRRVAGREVARRDRQVGLVDAVDLDVGELVDADDRDVDGEAGDQGGREIERVAGLVRGDGDRVQADDGQRGPDDRVRAREAPQHVDGADARDRHGNRGHGERRLLNVTRRALGAFAA
jgi:hypothetical protein